MLLVGKDMKFVTIFSNGYSVGMKSKRIILLGGREIMVWNPNVVINFTTSMGFEDRVDHYASAYCFMRKSSNGGENYFFVE